MPVVRKAVLTVLVAVLAAHTTASGQEAEKAKQAALQKKCYDTPEKNSPLHRLRIDGYTVKDNKVNIKGVFLHGGFDKIAKEKTDLNTALIPIVEGVFGKGHLPLTEKEFIKFIEPKDLPHVRLQAQANAEKRDEILVEPVTFNGVGEAVLTAQVGSAADKEWLTKAWQIESDKKVAPDPTDPADPTIKLSPVQTKIDEVKWKLGWVSLQEKLAASPGNLTHVRIERVWYEWNPKPGDLLEVLGVMSGICLDPAPPPADLNNLLTQLWLESTRVDKPALNPAPRAIAGESVVDERKLVKHLRTDIAKAQALDGVRIERGMSFDAGGRLLLVGSKPNPDPQFAKELAAAVEKIAKDAGIDPDRKAPAFSQATAGGVSAAKMVVIRTDELLAKLRGWAAEEVDDVLLRRLYFNPDPDGELTKMTLVGRIGEAGDVGEQILKKFLSISPEYFLDKNDPARGALTRELKPFKAGLTAYLVDEVQADQKMWAGTLIERGYFTYNSTGVHYSIRGLADNEKQQAEMVKLINREKTKPRWSEYFEDAPGPVTLELMPLAPMLSRLQVVCPGYEEFDHLEVTKVEQQPKAVLVLHADAYDPTGNESAEKQASTLFKRHQMWQRRAKGGVKIKTNQRANMSAESRWLRPYLGAEMLAKEKLPRALLELRSAIRHIPDSSGTWYLSALYHSYIGEPEVTQELVLRDLYRVIKLEKELIPTYGEFQDDARIFRYALVEKIGPSPERAAVEALEIWLRREMRDGRPQIQLMPGPVIVVPK
jgi:hypothetical protein